MKNLKYVRRELLTSSKSDNGGCGLILFFLMVITLIMILDIKPSEQARIDMMKRCAIDKEPPAFCVELIKK